MSEIQEEVFKNRTVRRQEITPGDDEFKCPEDDSYVTANHCESSGFGLGCKFKKECLGYNGYIEKPKSI